MATHQRKGGIAVLRNPRTGELKVVAYSRGTQYRYGSAENDALYKDWEVISPKEGGSLTADWLPTTRPGIVSRTADGAYGEHLKTRTPAHWLPTTQGVTVPQGGVGPTSAPGIQDVYAHPELYGIPLAPGYGQVVPSGGATYTPCAAPALVNGKIPPGYRKFVGPKGEITWGYSAEVAARLAAPPTGAAPPTAHYPQGFKGFTGRFNYKDWLTNAPAQLNQALSQLPAPLKDWLSNYPRLPQSTIPTPTVEYPAPGRPPKYNNPFAWRRKNNGWW